MNYEQKYLKYKQKYLELKAKLDGGFPGEANSSSIKNIQKALEKHSRNILVLDQAIKGRISKINSLENGKQKGINSLKKNNASPEEIKIFIEREDFYINATKEEIEVKTRELEQQKNLHQKNVIKLNELKKIK